MNKKNENQFVLTNGLRIAISIAFLVIAILLAILFPDRITITDSETYSTEHLEHTITTETQPSFLVELIHWLVLGLFLGIIWIWRKFLGINSLLGIGGEETSEFEQQEGGEQNDNHSIDSVFIENELLPRLDKLLSQKQDLRNDNENNNLVPNENLRKTLNLFKKYKIMRVSHIANELNISIKQAKQMAYELVNQGFLRVDGKDPNVIYSLSNSSENKTIDLLFDKINKNELILDQKRYVQYKNFDIDAIFETEKSVFFVEEKSSRFSLNFDKLNSLQNRFLSFSHDYQTNGKNLYFILVIGCESEQEFHKINMLIKNITFNSSFIKLSIHAFLLH